MTDELARLKRLVAMIPPAQLACLEAADEIIESGVLGPEWVLVLVGEHDARYDQRIIKWVRPRSDGWNAVLTILPPIKSNWFECQIGILDELHHGRSVFLHGPKLWGSTATHAVIGALLELDQHLKGRP